MKKRIILFVLCMLCMMQAGNASTLTLTGAQQYITTTYNPGGSWSSISSISLQWCPHGKVTWRNSTTSPYVYRAGRFSGINNASTTISAINALNGYGVVSLTYKPNSKPYCGIVGINGKHLNVANISQQVTGEELGFSCYKADSIPSELAQCSVSYVQSDKCTICNSLGRQPPAGTDIKKTYFSKVASGLTTSASKVVLNNCILSLYSNDSGINTFGCSVPLEINGGTYTGYPAITGSTTVTVTSGTFKDGDGSSTIFVADGSESSTAEAGRFTVTTVKKSSGSGGTVVVPTPSPL